MNQHTAWYTFILVFPLLLITTEQLFSSSISAKMALAAVVWTPGTVSQQGLVGRCDPSGLGNKALVLSLLIPDQAPRPPPPTMLQALLRAQCNSSLLSALDSSSIWMPRVGKCDCWESRLTEWLKIRVHSRQVGEIDYRGKSQ